MTYDLRLTTNDLILKDRQYIWHPYTKIKGQSLNIAIVKGEGTYLIDESGKKYIDAVSSWWVNLHGHAHPHIIEKVTEQLKKLEHVIFAGFTHEPAVMLAERLLNHLPEDHAKIFYSDNGSTAVEVSLKMAFQYWNNKEITRNKIVAFHHAYHGDTFGAMSVSGRSAFNAPFAPFLFDVIFIDPPLPGKIDECFLQMQEAINNNADDIAAFIFEPLVMGTAGMQMYEAEHLDKLMHLCKENNILTIADEVMTGFGRTGKFFATDYTQYKPDMICLSKGLTGGTMALGITSCTENIFNAFVSDDKMKTFFHGHSYTANPLACAASLASLDLMEMDQTWNNIYRITEQHKVFAAKLRSSKKIKDIRQCGTILAIEILSTGDDSSYFDVIRDEAYDYFIKRGVLLRPLGNIIYILPPYCISDEQLGEVYGGMESFVGKLESRI